MSDVAIRVEGLGKQYRIGGPQASYKTLRESLAGAVQSPIRRAGRLLRGEAATDHQETIWALKDVSFEVKHGEVLGIIGRNGAGKSTLLKILSRITAPTEGTVDLYGRVGSLLEVGTGFHPELTGRENIYLNGAILGMKRAEIDRKFDEIVAFAELEKFLDTPVKHYSSGMYVRLAFAVAAHLDPEILMVDEVLAVGDAAFQKKCLGKMGEVAGEGRTVLFVSHNMGAVTRLCNQSMWLNEGRIQMWGTASEVIGAYLRHDHSTQAERYWPAAEAPGDDSLKLRAVRLCQPSGNPSAAIDISEPFQIEVETDVLKPISEVAISVRVLAADGQVILHTADVRNSESLAIQVGRRMSVCRLPPHTLNGGTYLLCVSADIPNVRMIFSVENVVTWTVEVVSAEMGRYNPTAWKGFIGPGLATWSIGESSSYGAFAPGLSQSRRSPINPVNSEPGTTQRGWCSGSRDCPR